MSRLLAALAFLASSSGAMANDELRAAFSQRLATEVTHVSATPIDGLYEVRADGQIIYMTKDGRYALQGSLLDLEERRNLTDDARSALRKSLISEFPGGKSMQFAATGEQKHVIYVFTDLDCGYCRKLHLEVPQLNEAGVTVRYLAYPRAGVDSETYRTMVSVWCADNPQSALTAAKLGQPVPEKSCENPVKDEFELGTQLGVQGTPTIVLESGRELGGYAPAAEIVKVLNGGG